MPPPNLRPSFAACPSPWEHHHVKRNTETRRSSDRLASLRARSPQRGGGGGHGKAPEEAAPTCRDRQLRRTPSRKRDGEGPHRASPRPCNVTRTNPFGAQLRRRVTGFEQGVARQGVEPSPGLAAASPFARTKPHVGQLERSMRGRSEPELGRCEAGPGGTTSAGLGTRQLRSRARPKSNGAWVMWNPAPEFDRFVPDDSRSRRKFQASIQSSGPPRGSKPPHRVETARASSDSRGERWA